MVHMVPPDLRYSAGRLRRFGGFGQTGLRRVRKGNIYKVDILIRAETPDDYAAIYAVTEAAFVGTEHADGNEQELPDKLRQKVGFRPELSLVAELDGVIVGHVLFTEMTVGETPAVCVGPVSVLPHLQGKGIGAALMEAGHEAAHELDFSLCVLCGHEDYYPRFGYEPIGQHGITFPFDAPEACKMVKFLDERGKSVRGVAIFPPELMEGS